MKLETIGSKERRKVQMPDTYVILFSFIVVAAIATYFVPAGEFDRVTKGEITVTVPGSYHEVDAKPTSIMDFFRAFQTGMIESSSLIFLVLFTGGAFAIVEASGAINAGIMAAINKTKNKELLLIGCIAFLFSLGGVVEIVANSVIAFIPIGILLARAMKLDAIIGVAIIYLGAYAGFNTGFLNPFTLGLAQQIAEVPIFSGMMFRIILYLIIVMVTIVYISLYAKKILKDPTKSIMGPQLFAEGDEKALAETKFTLRHKSILLYFISCLAFYVFGTRQWDWQINEMAAMFIIIAIGSGILARMSANDIVKAFIKGAQKLVYGALVIGVARAILVILQDGKILDTVVQGLAIALEPLSPVAGAIGMFIGNALFNILVSSGTGQAVVAMPILTPLADMLAIPRQVAVQAFQLGDGFTNSIIPTSGVLMASLAVGGVPYTKWVKFMWPLMAIWLTIGCIAIAIGVIINWGPL